MPYAGFFEEKLNRDKKINKNNKKNNVGDYLNFCVNNKIKLINVFENDCNEFLGNKLILEKLIVKKKINDLKPEKYLEYYKKEFSKIDEDYIKNILKILDLKTTLSLYFVNRR